MIRPDRPRRRTVLATALTGLLATAGCALAPPVAGPRWSGRLALRVDGDDAASWSAAFELQGSATAGALALYGPLGGTLAQVNWSAESALLLQGERRLTYPDIGALLRELSGAELPLGALFDWLDGRPAAPPGWTADLTQLAQGALIARRDLPPPAVTLRVRLDPP